MSKNTDLIEQYYAVRKGDFGYLERIELVQDVDPVKCNGFQLTIVLRSGTDSSSPALRLEFKGGARYSHWGFRGPRLLHARDSVHRGEAIGRPSI